MDSQKKGHRYLKTISTPQQIHNHPTNTSQSKCLYTFPKASRFSVYNNDKHIRADYYDVDLKYLKSQRACSLGKGNKSDFTKNMGESPGPCQYSSIVNTIKQKVEKSKGISFGLSREKCKIVGQRDTKFDKVFPGPGTYKIKSDFDPTNLKHVSFRIKTKQLKEENLDIGPGKYNIKPLIGEASSKWMSTYKGNGTAKINPLPKVLRALDQNTQNPNIAYDQTFQINKEGKYFNSKYQNTKLGFISKAKRDFIKTDNNIPGPGTYQAPSDFGIYKSSIATQLVQYQSLFSAQKESVSTYPSLIFAQESVFLCTIPSSFYTFRYPLCLETLVYLSVQFSLVKYPTFTFITISLSFL